MENISHAGCLKVNSYLFLMRTDLGTGKRVKPYVCAGGGVYAAKTCTVHNTQGVTSHISVHPSGCSTVVFWMIFPHRLFCGRA